MTKDWDAVQAEIKELSFGQKKPLGEVKELMEKKYKFRASTRAYRMKLKEWGLMRYRRYKVVNGRSVKKGPEPSRCEEDDHNETGLSVSIEPTPIEIDPPALNPCIGLSDAIPSIVSSLELPPVSLPEQPLSGTLAKPRTTESDIVLTMLNAVLEDDSEELERLLIANPTHVNDPIGLPFEKSNSRFHAHPAIKDVGLLQHPGQTLLDIACGKPNGPAIWMLLMYNAQGSKHPLGTDLALHNAIRNNRLYNVEALLVHDRSHINGHPGTTWDPLLQAVFWTWPDIVRILIARGANVDISEHSSYEGGDSTALKVCLQHRKTYYMARTTKAHCNEILKMLLDAGASLSVPNMPLSPFEMFIEPWQANPYWHTESKISSTELDCLRIFVEKGADLQAHFSNYPCHSASSSTFAHQVLWHSAPKVARFLVDSVPHNPGPNGARLLHEVLGSCPDARRHPEDMLQDIDVLIQRGVNLNAVDNDGKPPLVRCIENCAAADLIPCLEKLLVGGADPEREGPDGIQSYVIAARKLKEPLLLKVMQLFVSHIRGCHTMVTDGSSHSWHQGYFPISEDLTYTQLVACYQDDSEFMFDLRNMVPEDIQPSFRQAYFAIASNNYLTSMAKLAALRRLDTTEIQEITQTISMREAAGLSDHKLDHQLILSLLGSHSSSSAETTNDTTIPPAHVPFQLNTNTPATTSHVPNTPHRTESDAEDFFALSTTQIRWHDPCAKPQPGDLQKAIADILQFECEVCANGKLLTKKEVEKHGIEHAHSKICSEMNCQRRFCR